MAEFISMRTWRISEWEHYICAAGCRESTYHADYFTFDEDVKGFCDSLTTVISQRLAGSDNFMPLKYGLGTKSATRMLKKRKGSCVALLCVSCYCLLWEYKCPLVIFLCSAFVEIFNSSFFALISGRIVLWAVIVSSSLSCSLLYIRIGAHHWLLERKLGSSRKLTSR